MFVDVHDVRKKYPGKWALRGVSFGAEKGLVTGLLGENGAGKSTLLRIVASVTRPTSGSVTVDGLPVGLETRAITAFLPEVNPFYEWMKVMEQMEFLAAFYEGWDMRKTRELLASLALPENDRIGTLSRGQQAKLKWRSPSPGRTASPSWTNPSAASIRPPETHPPHDLPRVP